MGNTTSGQNKTLAYRVKQGNTRRGWGLSVPTVLQDSSVEARQLSVWGARRESTAQRMVVQPGRASTVCREDLVPGPPHCASCARAGGLLLFPALQLVGTAPRGNTQQTQQDPVSAMATAVTTAVAVHPVCRRPTGQHTAT